MAETRVIIRDWQVVGNYRFEIIDLFVADSGRILCYRCERKLDLDGNFIKYTYINEPTESFQDSLFSDDRPKPILAQPLNTTLLIQR